MIECCYVDDKGANNMRSKIISFILVFMLLFSSATSVYGLDNNFTDIPYEDHWSYNALKSAVDNGLLMGFNNIIDPEGKATRAQIAAVINRAFGATDTADISGFADVSEKDWYYTDMSKALNMGAILGSTDKMLLPLKNVTRQEAFCIIAHVLKLRRTNIEALSKFSDKDDIAEWAKEASAALVENNYIFGFNGRLNPNGEITRAEFAQIMYNIIKTYITIAGVYTLSIEGNVMINCPNVTLKDCIINGDLIIGDGVGNGEITLDNTKIEGRLLARGGGQNTVLIKNNSTIGNVVISKTSSGAIRIKTEDGARVEYVYIDDGKDDVILEGLFNQITVETDTPVVIKNANVNIVNVKAEGADISVEGKTSITTIDFDKAALDSKIIVSDGSHVNDIQINNPRVEVIGWNKPIVNTGSSGSQPPSEVEDNIAPKYKGCEVTGEKTLSISFSEPVLDGTNNNFLNTENFRVVYLEPKYVEDLSSAGIEFFEKKTYTIQSAELFGDTIILTLTESLSEGRLKVYVNSPITENPVQDYAGNVLSPCEVTFNYVIKGDTSSQVTVEKADEDMVTLVFSKPVTATDLKLFHTDSNVEANMSTPVSISKGTFVSKISFEFPNKIPKGTTDLFLVNSSDPGSKAFNIYGEYVPDLTLVADVEPEKTRHMLQILI